MLYNQIHNFRRFEGTVNFEEMKQMVDANKDGTVLLDVRSRDEFRDGHIPNSFNVPVDRFNDAFELPEDQFRQLYGFPKPKKNSKIVTSCLKGIRAANAAEILTRSGYTNVNIYKGSFDDWKNKGGDVVQ
ncbi:unnamed protein product [Notodromas monacha]|uniref:Rhodanese domain-containing protein n=1 Tax=Notodromas monacha TaxID=399045 RepID=A0A7R9BSG5_9CRUS|nr:unnamed protein product [Notodromas monacha]CAG0920872.1 unnamed protein product [Notodromas monacha]